MARKMKDSGIEWIGEIPEGWETINPKALFAQRKDRASKGERQLTSSQQYGILYQDEYMELTGSKVVTVEKDFDILKHVETGDFVISMRSFQGGLEYSTKSGAISSAYVMLVPNLELVYPRFYRWLLKSSVYIDALQRTTNMVRDGQAMRYSNFAQVRLFTLPLDEQKSRADFLDLECSSIDKILFKTRSSIEEYKKLKQAVITQAVTKGVRGEREMKDSGVDYIGQIPAKWVLGKLRNVGDTQNGISKSSEFFGKGFPFVSYSDVYKNYSLPFAVSGLVESTPEEQERYSVKEGDIFFTRTSETIEEVGFSCVCEKDIPNATFAGFLIRVRPFSDKLHTPYAKYYFRSSHLRFYLVKEMNLVTRASLGQSLLKSMPVLLPPLEEQKEIADYLDAKCAEIDGLIAKKEQLVKEMESYKKSLIYEVVTGKREV